MNRGPQVHIFWGAPVAALKMTVSQETASLMSTANTWEKVQLFFKQRSLCLKAGDQEFKSLEDCQVPEGFGPPGLLSGHLLTTYVNRSAQAEEDFKHSESETQNVKSQKISLSDMTSVCRLTDRVQHLPEEEKYQKLPYENKKIIDEQSKTQSDACVQNFQRDVLQLDRKCAAELDLGYSSGQKNTGPEAEEKKPEPTGHRETQSQESFASDTQCEPQSEGAVRQASGQRISPDTEFLRVMTASQRAFLAQGNDKGQDYINKRTVNLEAEPTGSQGVRGTEGNFSEPGGDFEEGSESEQSQAYSLELFSPVCPESESSYGHINPGKSLEENISSPELSSREENLPQNEAHVELCGSGVLCSQPSSSHRSTAKRSQCSKDNARHSTAHSEVHQVSKKARMDSPRTWRPPPLLGHRRGSEW